jgi:hypothetical protein
MAGAALPPDRGRIFYVVDIDASREHAPPELDAAARHRREAERRMSMSERLAALHELCKQLTAVDGVARRK